MPEHNAPIDKVHAACLAARDELRDRFAILRRRAALWVPNPNVPPTARQTVRKQ